MILSKSHDKTTSALEKLCIDKKLKMTEQRRVIARVLSESKDHPDVDTVFQRAYQQDKNISIATVYRTIRLFEEESIIQKHDFGDGRARYEEISESHHDHFINIDNYEVSEFFDAEIERLQERIANRYGYELVDHRLELYVKAGNRFQQAKLWNEKNSIGNANLQVRLATSYEEIKLSQKLRYSVFIEEMAGNCSQQEHQEKREFDIFDDYCDHLQVIDTTSDSIVGTYRLVRSDHAKQIGKFYTETEFDLTKVKENGGKLLELGRSCVLSEYRSGATIQMLWKAIMDYIAFHDIDTAFGCASFATTDVESILPQLVYLHNHHLADENILPKALDHLAVDISKYDTEQDSDGQSISKRVIASLPPLIKGYLKMGVSIGENAIIDHVFNTTDVCIVVKAAVLRQNMTKFM